MGTHKFPALEMPLHCGWKERVRDERSMREKLQRNKQFFVFGSAVRC